MPPKKGKKPVVIDGVDTTLLTREQLEVFAVRLRDEMQREREERNYFQLERDKIRTYWDITKQQLDEVRASIRNKERDIEEMEEKNQFEMKCFKQKVKHLMYEHQQQINDIRAKGVLELKAAQDDHDAQEAEILRDKTELKNRLRELEQETLEQIRSLKNEHSKEISEVRRNFEIVGRELESNFEKKMKDMKSEMEVIHRMEMTEVEERKNQQIADLIKNHEIAFRDLKIYYNDITINNLALITCLKEQMEILKDHSERMERQVSDIQAENKKLTQPLHEANVKMDEMSKKLQNYEKDKIALANARKELVTVKKEYNDLKWENGALELRFEKMECERNNLQTRFIEAVLELQQKTGLKACLLQNKVDDLTQSAEQKNALLEEILEVTNLPQIDLNNKIENILKRKNNEIQDLHYELARVSKAHDDLLNTYECKLLQYGIPLEELGFLPLRTNIKNLGKGPAGLVAKNR